MHSGVVLAQVLLWPSTSPRGSVPRNISRIEHSYRADNIISYLQTLAYNSSRKKFGVVARMTCRRARVMGWLAGWRVLRIGAVSTLVFCNVTKSSLTPGLQLHSLPSQSNWTRCTRNRLLLSYRQSLLYKLAPTHVHHLKFFFGRKTFPCTQWKYNYRY